MENSRKKVTFNNFYKTKVCPWYEKGVCRWGSKCNYAHADAEQRRAVDLTKTKLCCSYLGGFRCVNPACRYAHSTHELRATTDVYKTSLCSFYRFNMTCPMGSRCRFAHGDAELRKIPDVSPIRQPDSQNEPISNSTECSDVEGPQSSNVPHASHHSSRYKSNPRISTQSDRHRPDHYPSSKSPVKRVYASASECVPPVAQVVIPGDKAKAVPLTCDVTQQLEKTTHIIPNFSDSNDNTPGSTMNFSNQPFPKSVSPEDLAQYIQGLIEVTDNALQQLQIQENQPNNNNASNNSSTNTNAKEKSQFVPYDHIEPMYHKQHEFANDNLDYSVNPTTSNQQFYVNQHTFQGFNKQIIPDSPETQFDALFMSTIPNDPSHVAHSHFNHNGQTQVFHPDYLGPYTVQTNQWPNHQY